MEDMRDPDPFYAIWMLMYNRMSRVAYGEQYYHSPVEAQWLHFTAGETILARHDTSEVLTREPDKFDAQVEELLVDTRPTHETVGFFWSICRILDVPVSGWGDVFSGLPRAYAARYTSWTIEQVLGVSII